MRIHPSSGWPLAVCASTEGSRWQTSAGISTFPRPLSTAGLRVNTRSESTCGTRCSRTIVRSFHRPDQPPLVTATTHSSAVNPVLSCPKPTFYKVFFQKERGTRSDLSTSQQDRQEASFIRPSKRWRNLRSHTPTKDGMSITQLLGSVLVTTPVLTTLSPSESFTLMLTVVRLSRTKQKLMVLRHSRSSVRKQNCQDQR
jgi:hypothetical protein